MWVQPPPRVIWIQSGPLSQETLLLDSLEFSWNYCNLLRTLRILVESLWFLPESYESYRNLTGISGILVEYLESSGICGIILESLESPESFESFQNLRNLSRIWRRFGNLWNLVSEKSSGLPLVPDFWSFIEVSSMFLKMIIYETWWTLRDELLPLHGIVLISTRSTNNFKFYN